MSKSTTQWYMLTPRGALYAFGSEQPDEIQRILQALVSSNHSLETQEWENIIPGVKENLEHMFKQNWIQRLNRPITAPETQLDNFLQHVVAALSGERRAALSLDSGFCIGSTGLKQEEVETWSVAAADFADFLVRQQRRGWTDIPRRLSLHDDFQLLLPAVSFVPLWIDEVGYWLILSGEPLLNNLALVELCWILKFSGNRFSEEALSGGF